MPIIYPQLLAFPLVTAFLASADCPWPALGTVHLGNRIAQHQPLQSGDALRVEMRTGAADRAREGADLHARIANPAGGELVWDGTQSLLRIGVKDPADRRT